MKSIKDMTRLEFAAFISSAFQDKSVNIVLSGGSCVSRLCPQKRIFGDRVYVEAKDTRKVINISKANAELKTTTVAKIDRLRADINAIETVIEGGGVSYE